MELKELKIWKCRICGEPVSLTEAGEHTLIHHIDAWKTVFQKISVEEQVNI